MSAAARHGYKIKLPDIGDDGDGDNPFGDDPFNDDDDGGGGGGGNGDGPSSSLVNTGPSGTPAPTGGDTSGTLPPTGTDASGDALSGILSGMLNSQTDDPFGILTGGTQDPFGGAFNYDTGDPSGGISIDITGISTDLTGDPSGGLGTITDPLGNPTTDPTGATGQGQGANNNNFQYQGPISAPQDTGIPIQILPPIADPTPVTAPTSDQNNFFPLNPVLNPPPFDLDPSDEIDFSSDPYGPSTSATTQLAGTIPTGKALAALMAQNLAVAQAAINQALSFLGSLSNQIVTQNSYINIFNGIATLLNIISSFTGKIDLNKPTSGNSVDLENQVDYYTGILNEIENFITTLRTLESETAAIPPTLLFPGMNADQSFLYLEDTIRQLDNYEDGINMEIGYLKKLLGP